MFCVLGYEKIPASRAYSSSSGGATCPGATRGQPQGSTPRSQGVILGRFKRKKFFVMDGHTHKWTDRCASRNSDVDVLIEVIVGSVLSQDI